MCELLGLSFNTPVRPAVSFRGFQPRSVHNPDGWGIAYYADGKACTYKEAVSANASALATSIHSQMKLRSRIFIGHVRLATRGGISLQNTHPFCRNFAGRDVVFAHNGTIHELPWTDSFLPEGTTDSEAAFCGLLCWMREKQISFERFAELETWLRQLNAKATLNVLLSNGDYLYAYRDGKGYKGLCAIFRQAPFDELELSDADWKLNLEQQKPAQQHGYIIATHALTDEPWTDFRPGRMVVFKHGKIVYGGPDGK
jgi:predicted glutamine amidotransferase